MRKIFSLTTLYIAITFLSNCIGLSESNGVKTSLGLLAFLTSGSSGASSGSGSDNPTPLPAPAPQVSEPPTIQGLPNGAPAQAFSVSESSLSLPASINNTLVPVGKVYDLGIDTSKLDSALTPPALGTTSSVLFATPVQIQYNYDKAALKSSGFVEEFYVYYFDAGQNKWLPVKGVTVDTQNSIVTATTDHFTPFVLVAAPAIANTTAPAPPACIANDFPSGIGGHGGAKFTTVDLAAMFYQDRNYVFDSTAGAPTFNAFNNFGFRNALGISPCNGGAGGGSVGGITCQNADFPADHKFYPGNDYIVFTAHTNLDVYVIFEDIPNIPTWLKPAAGFVYTGQKMNNIVLSPMDFKIYRKTFLQGQTIQLGGGWNGTTNPSTNYTVILKRAGDTSQGTASNLCEATPDNAPPLNITNLKAIPGSTTAILQWENPDDPNFDGVVIRRGLGVSLMGQGVSPAGSSPNINTFRVTGLTQGNTYTFSVFALDKNAKWVKNTISVTTGPDGDSDNLSNSFETLSGSLYNFSSDKVLTDTDGDGIDDETEWINGTNPNGNDTVKPVVNTFNLTTANPTQLPIATFQTAGIDNVAISGWMITRTLDPPLGTDSRWMAGAPPFSKNLVSIANYSFFVWAKDAAGNVSNLYSPVTVNLDGFKIPKFLYETNDLANTLGVYAIDFVTGFLSPVQSIPFAQASLVNGNRGPLGIAIHPNGKYVYVTDSSSIFAYNADQTNGTLSAIETEALGNRPNDPTDQLFIHPSGKFLYAFNSPSTKLNIFDINSDGSLTYKNNFTFSSYSFNNQVGNFNNSVFQTDFSSVSMNEFSIPFSTREAFRNKLFVDFSGNFLVSRTLTNMTPCQTGWGGNIVSCWGFSHHYTNTTYTIDQSSGLIAFLGSGIEFVSDNSGAYNFLELISSFDFGYSNHFSSFIQYDGGSTFGNYGSGDPSTSQIVNTRLHQCVKNPRVWNFLEPYLIGCEPVKGYDLGFHFVRMHLDPTGNFLYVPDSDDATNGAHFLNAFRVDQSTGNLTVINTDVVGSSSVFDVKVLDLHDYNDPPVVTITAPASQFHNINAGAVSLNASNSYDPDYVRCNANTGNYTYKWTLTGKPGNSTLTSANIFNSTTRSSAYMFADVTGDYTFTFSFTDDHGTCAGVNKTKTGSVTIQVRKVYQTGTMNWTDPPPSNYIRWTQKTGKAEVDKGHIERDGWAVFPPGQGIPGIPFIGGWVAIAASCNSQNEIGIDTRENSLKNCHISGLIVLTGEKWILDHKEIVEATGTWSYWSM